MIKSITNDCRCLIKIGSIKKFVNICQVTKQKEYCNVEVEYSPNGKIIELGSYRRYFASGFKMLIEDICSQVYRDIMTEINPKFLKVTIYLLKDEKQKLTPWSVTKTSKYVQNKKNN